MRTNRMLILATVLVAGTATAASACGVQASLQTGRTVLAAATAQDFSAESKKTMRKDEMNEPTMNRSTTGAPAGVNPSGGPGTGTTPAPKSSSTGNAGTGAGAAGGEAAGDAVNNGH